LLLRGTTPISQCFSHQSIHFLCFVAMRCLAIPLLQLYIHPKLQQSYKLLKFFPCSIPGYVVYTLHNVYIDLWELKALHPSCSERHSLSILLPPFHLWEAGAIVFPIKQRREIIGSTLVPCNLAKQEKCSSLSRTM